MVTLERTISLAKRAVEARKILVNAFCEWGWGRERKKK